MHYLIISLITALLSFFALRGVVKEKRKRRKLLLLAKAFDRLVLQNKLSVEHAETIGHRVIGLDRRNKKLVFTDHTRKQKQEICISLLSIAYSRLEEERNSDGSISRVLIGLKTKNGEWINLCLFDETCEALTGLPAISRRAMYWKNRVDIHKQSGTMNLEYEYVL